MDVGNKVIYSHVWTKGGNRQQPRQQRTLRRRMNLRFSHRERVGDTDSIAGGFERVLVAMLPIIVVTGRSFIRFNAVDLWRSVALRPSSAALTTLAIVAAVRIADNDRRATGVLTFRLLLYSPFELLFRRCGAVIRRFLTAL